MRALRLAALSAALLATPALAQEALDAEDTFATFGVVTGIATPMSAGADVKGTVGGLLGFGKRLGSVPVALAVEGVWSAGPKIGGDQVAAWWVFPHVDASFPMPDGWGFHLFGGAGYGRFEMRWADGAIEEHAGAVYGGGVGLRKGILDLTFRYLAPKFTLDRPDSESGEPDAIGAGFQLAIGLRGDLWF
jgi:hypothetical protein